MHCAPEKPILAWYCFEMDFNLTVVIPQVFLLWKEEIIIITSNLITSRGTNAAEIRI